MQARTLLFAAMVAIALPATASDRIPIVDEGGANQQWTPVPGTVLMPAYPAEYASQPEEVCLTVGYLLNADGHTSDFALLKSWSSGGNPGSRTGFWETFAGAASQALAQWRFAPKPGVASTEPVYTAATFVFGPTGATGVQAHCAISDLATRLLELRTNDRSRRLMSRGIFSQLEIDPKVEERYRQQRLAVRENQDTLRMDQNMRDQEDAAKAYQPQPPSSGNQ